MRLRCSGYRVIGGRLRDPYHVTLGVFVIRAAAQGASLEVLVNHEDGILRYTIQQFFERVSYKLDVEQLKYSPDISAEAEDEI